MTNPKEQQYTALLRGINVGGHHKVPMAELRKTLEDMGFTQVKTLLNSGNVVFSGRPEQETVLEKKIAAQLESTFKFPIPVLIRNSEEILKLVASNPFRGIEVHKDIRLYVTFLNTPPQDKRDLPRVSPEGSFQIIKITDRSICSVLDLSISRTPEAMSALEKSYGKIITTRNWNTIEKIAGMF